MRWDELKVEVEEERRLPGYSDGAMVRTFDAPEALDTRFYEVRAKSALNRVPEQSQVPFRWTINPYRGCTHACTYCASGDTTILMADGRRKPLADIRVGDRIYGTVRDRFYRRYAITEVLDQWSTVKSAYRVVLEDGTELVTSGDHRFLSRRGWKHVSNTPRGCTDRAHLTLNDKLLGTGGFARGPRDSPDYREGYLCGLIRGDATIGSYRYRRASGREDTVHGFRLALTDFEALRRAREYLSDIGVPTREFEFKATATGGRPMRAISNQARDHVSFVRDLIRWPRSPNIAWQKGFLAGIFDAEGSNHGALRISNTNPEIIDWTVWSFRQLGFNTITEDRRQPNGLKVVRLLGGLRERLRFFHTTEPAISRKRDFSGTAIKSDAKLKVASIEPLGVDLPLYDITTGTGDFIANGVVSHNCFARPTHKFLDMDAGRDFEKEIVVKVNVPEVLRRELARPSWKGEHVALGTNTDPYQWVEGRYKLMPGIWEAFRDFRNPCSILTKSPLLLRDLPLMQEVAKVAPIQASLSIPTLEEKAWRATEPHTPNPRARIEAVAELNRAGIPCGVLIAPLMPGINDAPEQVERILELCTEAGATHISGIALHLRGEVRDIFMGWLRSQRPDLVPRYEKLYARGAYATRAERERLSALVARGRSRLAGYVREQPMTRWRPERADKEEVRKESTPPQQPSLF